MITGMKMICKRDFLNNKAMKALGCALISDEFNRVCNYEMAKVLEIDNFLFLHESYFLLYYVLGQI